ncbi:Hypothetical protein, putative [Bodo saltans]|uniref:C3H1-type domain-containing protein n=1 Tax=Bodo saltans TaxID=75058 RepID=A0A0S4JF28_BODSA|nr:Hypothetical protein, putative [Bodo saltans]|eukprot:CUG88579.1 Hypothetical protein, putative [Bodo saltans]
MFLGVTLNKEQQTSDWATHRLGFEQAAYAANDAITSALIGQHLRDHGGDVQRWVRAAEERLNRPAKHERKAAKQTEPPVPKTVKPPALNNEVLRVFYLGHEIESVSRGYAIHKLKNCCFAKCMPDGTTEEDVVILHAPPTRRAKPCIRFRDGNCEAGDSCPHIHKNRIAAQEELYEEWGRMFATRDFSSACIACGTSLLAHPPDAN